MMDVADRLGTLNERLADALRRCGRPIDDVRLVAVSKGHSPVSILEAYAAGHRAFGESRGQSLAAKAKELPDEIEWHFIGPLQRNKVRIVRPHVVLLHSFDRDGLVGPWLKGLGHPPPALLQVNVGMEPQKAGVEPPEVLAAFERWEESGINLQGIMAIPPIGDSPEGSRPYFAEMKAIHERLMARVGRPIELSMGMTHDFEVAIEEGSTMIRVGTAIFGPRPPLETNIPGTKNVETS